jgi:hypothetical protein
VVQAYLRAFAERTLTLAGTPAVGDIAAPSVHPLRLAALASDVEARLFAAIRPAQAVTPDGVPTSSGGRCNTDRRLPGDRPA